MAERRMFSRAILESERFLRMPVSSRLLYIYLCMNADDDGVAQGYSIMKAMDFYDYDLEPLIKNNFVVRLDPNENILFITEWTIHNHIGKTYRPGYYYNLVMEYRKEHKRKKDANENG